MIDTGRYALIIDEFTKGVSAAQGGSLSATVALELRDLRDDCVVTTAYAGSRDDARCLLIRSLLSQGWKPEDAEVFSTPR